MGELKIFFLRNFHYWVVLVNGQNSFLGYDTMERIFVTHIRAIMDTMATGSMGLLCSPCPALTYGP